MTNGCVWVNSVVWSKEGRSVPRVCSTYKICHRTGRPMHEYLYYFIAARNSRASAAVSELALMIPRCRIDQFSQSFLPSDVHL